MISVVDWVAVFWQPDTLNELSLTNCIEAPPILQVGGLMTGVDKQLQSSIRRIARLKNVYI